MSDAQEAVNRQNPYYISLMDTVDKKRLMIMKCTKNIVMMLFVALAAAITNLMSCGITMFTVVTWFLITPLAIYVCIRILNSAVNSTAHKEVNDITNGKLFGTVNLNNEKLMILQAEINIDIGKLKSLSDMVLIHIIGLLCVLALSILSVII